MVLLYGGTAVLTSMSIAYTRHVARSGRMAGGLGDAIRPINSSNIGTCPSFLLSRAKIPNESVARSSSG